MPKQEIWPPPPTTRDPTVTHDEFLTPLVCAPATKRALSRLRLCLDLRNCTGLPLRQCMEFVNSYCDRNAILRPMRGPFVWHVSLVPLIAMVTLVSMMVTQSSFQRSIDAATTYSAQHAIRAERLHVDYMFLVVLVGCSCVNLVTVLLRSRKARRDAADARAKMLRSRMAVPQDDSRARE